MTLDEARANIGADVVYRPWGQRSDARLEYGRISSVNDHYVFVRYRGDTGSKGSYAEELTLYPRAPKTR